MEASAHNIRTAMRELTTRGFIFSYFICVRSGQALGSVGWFVCIGRNTGHARVPRGYPQLGLLFLSPSCSILGTATTGHPSAFFCRNHVPLDTHAYRRTQAQESGCDRVWFWTMWHLNFHNINTLIPLQLFGRGPCIISESARLGISVDNRSWWGCPARHP
jgi:hypothetical protein